RRTIGSAAVCTAAAFLGWMMAAPWGTGVDPVDHITPIARAERAIDQVQDALSPTRRDALVAGARAQMAAAWGIDDRTLDLLRDRPVHIGPYEADVAWVYGLDWRPLP